MEFDWKRRPNAVKQVEFPDHVAFSTQPWETNTEVLDWH